MEKIAVDLDKLLDDFELDEDESESVSRYDKVQLEFCPEPTPARHGVGLGAFGGWSEPLQPQAAGWGATGQGAGQQPPGDRSPPDGQNDDGQTSVNCTPLSPPNAQQSIGPSAHSNSAHPPVSAPHPHTGSIQGAISAHTGPIQSIGSASQSQDSPKHSVRNQSIPGQSLATHSVPGQSLASHSTPGQSLASQSIPNQSLASNLAASIPQMPSDVVDSAKNPGIAADQVLWPSVAVQGCIFDGPAPSGGLCPGKVGEGGGGGEEIRRGGGERGVGDIGGREGEERRGGGERGVGDIGGREEEEREAREASRSFEGLDIISRPLDVIPASLPPDVGLSTGHEGRHPDIIDIWQSGGEHTASIEGSGGHEEPEDRHHRENLAGYVDRGNIARNDGPGANFEDSDGSRVSFEGSASPNQGHYQAGDRPGPNYDANMGPDHRLLPDIMANNNSLDAEQNPAIVMENSLSDLQMNEPAIVQESQSLGRLPEVANIHQTTERRHPSTIQSDLQSNIGGNIQSTSQSNPTIQSNIGGDLQSTIQSTIGGNPPSTIQSTSQSNLQSTIGGNIPSTIDPTIQSNLQSTIQSTGHEDGSGGDEGPGVNIGGPIQANPGPNVTLEASQGPSGPRRDSPSANQSPDVAQNPNIAREISPDVARADLGRSPDIARSDLVSPDVARASPDVATSNQGPDIARSDPSESPDVARGDQGQDAIVQKSSPDVAVSNQSEGEGAIEGRVLGGVVGGRVDATPHPHQSGHQSALPDVSAVSPVGTVSAVSPVSFHKNEDIADEDLDAELAELEEEQSRLQGAYGGSLASLEAERFGLGTAAGVGGQASGIGGQGGQETGIGGQESGKEPGNLSVIGGQGGLESEIGGQSTGNASGIGGQSTENASEIGGQDSGIGVQGGLETGIGGLSSGPDLIGGMKAQSESRESSPSTPMDSPRIVQENICFPGVTRVHEVICQSDRNPGNSLNSMSGFGNSQNSSSGFGNSQNSGFSAGNSVGNGQNNGSGFGNSLNSASGFGNSSGDNSNSQNSAGFGNNTSGNSLNSASGFGNSQNSANSPRDSQNSTGNNPNGSGAGNTSDNCEISGENPNTNTENSESDRENLTSAGGHITSAEETSNGCEGNAPGDDISSSTDTASSSSTLTDGELSPERRVPGGDLREGDSAVPDSPSRLTPGSLVTAVYDDDSGSGREDDGRGAARHHRDHGNPIGQQVGMVAPFWVPDEDAATCQECGQKFTVIRRRHHCRACGRVLCAACCHDRAPLPYMDYKEARVCVACLVLLQSGGDSGDDSVSAAQRESELRRTAPDPNNPMEYCSRVPPPQQAAASPPPPPPTVMVPVGVLKREGSSSNRSKQVIFSDGIRPGGDLLEGDGGGGGGGGGGLGGGGDAPPPPFGRRTGRVTRRLDHPVTEYVLGEGNDGNNSNSEQLQQQLRGDGPPVAFALLKNLTVLVKLVKLECCVGVEVWNIATRGLCTVGQEEVVVLLEVSPDETQPPKDIFPFFITLYNHANQGQLVTALGHTIFSEAGGGGGLLGSRDHGGFLYVRPTFQCLRSLLLPPAPYIFAILIQKWETPWAKVFPLRLMLRMGAEFRYYPCPLVSTRNRKPVFCEIGHTIMNLLVDFRNYSYTVPSIDGFVIHMEDKRTSLLFPRNRYDQVTKALSNSNDHVLALGGNFSPAADSHLVTIENEDGHYSTQAINIHNRPRKVTGASFIVFNGALKTTSGLSAKSSIVEDGLMVQIPADMMTKLRDALQHMRDFDIPCGPTSAPQPDEVVSIKWTNDDKNFNVGIKSPVDDSEMDGIPSVKIHSGTDYVSHSHLIRWTEVFILQGDSNNSGDVNLSRVWEMLARSFCLALTPHLPELAASSHTRLALRTTLHQDSVGYEAGSGGSKLPASCMRDLDTELIPVIHRAATNITHHPIILELLFHILEQ